MSTPSATRESSRTASSSGFVSSLPVSSLPLIARMISPWLTTPVAEACEPGYTFAILITPWLLREVDLRIDADLPVALLQGDLADPVELHEALFVLLQLRLLHVEPHPADRPHDLKRVVVTGLDDLQRHSACAHHAARQRARMQSGLAGTPSASCR